MERAYRLGVSSSLFHPLQTIVDALVGPGTHRPNAIQLLSRIERELEDWIKELNSSSWMGRGGGSTLMDADRNIANMQRDVYAIKELKYDIVQLVGNIGDNIGGIATTWKFRDKQAADEALQIEILGRFDSLVHETTRIVGEIAMDEGDETVSAAARELADLLQESYSDLPVVDPQSIQQTHPKVQPVAQPEEPAVPPAPARRTTPIKS